MAERRRYTKGQKVVAITAALASSVSAAAEQQGIPRKTLEYWLDRPEFAELRQKTQDDLAAEMRTLAHVLTGKLAARADELDPKDLVIALGIVTDKSQLLSGHATNRTETKALSDSLTDHEKQQFRDALDRLSAEPAEAGEGEPAIGTGAEVRE